MSSEQEPAVTTDRDHVVGLVLSVVPSVDSIIKVDQFLL